jgi:phage terminase large subunit
MRPPLTTAKADWPPDYVSVFAWRQQQVLKLKGNPFLLAGAKEFYRTRPVEFINHWCDTYDPRIVNDETPRRIPLIMFPRQEDLVRFLHALVQEQQPGLIEKARDMGATWVACAFTVWCWLYMPGAAIGWGSRKKELVDRLGDPSSIFEKLRMIIRGLPRMFWPAWFDPSKHMTYMKIINPDTGASIIGEIGDDIGRGGRTLLYFKDESAHYERPELIEAALGDNTRVPIDISSVNGLGNVFHRRRESGVEYQGEIIHDKINVFVMDWRDHPEKTQAWYEGRKLMSSGAGLSHIFAQEVDRNYSASVFGTIIKHEWVMAAIDADKKLGFTDDGMEYAGLDVADEGGDLNALARRKGPCLKSAEDWGDGDVGSTARRAFVALDGAGRVALQYDSVGVGAGVKAEANRLKEEGKFPKNIEISPWSAGAGVLNPDDRVIQSEDGLTDKESPLNKDFYANLKAQGWWQLARRFERTYRAVVEGIKYSPDELISIPGDLPNLQKLIKELCQATSKQTTGTLKIAVDKSPPGTKSPNLADAVVMCYWPVTGPPPLLIGTYG